MKNSGFTLVELLIVIVLIAILMVSILVTIDPVEQLKRAEETGRKVFANELVRAIERYQASIGSNPDMSPIKPSIDCKEIVDGEPVDNIVSLKNEISDWFPAKIHEDDKRLFVGILPRSGLTKVCYQVKSASGLSKAAYDGCLVNSKFFLCLPE